MKKNERLIVQCSCGTIVESVLVKPGKGGVIVESGKCWKCNFKFKYDVSSRPWIAGDKRSHID